VYFVQVLLYDAFHITRMNRVQIDDVCDGKGYRFREGIVGINIAVVVR
jgi:hypothetical protein